MRTPSDFPNYQQSSVVLSTNDTGRCVVSADKASHYCGDIEVTAPPFPPPEAGQCHFSSESSREICWPRYEDLDTTCTDVGNGMVSAPAVKHAAIRAMAFVPPDNLRRLVRQYYRQKGLSVPRNTTFSKNSFLFALYECDDGYEFVDEVNSMFCINRHWVITPPKCRGKGMCEIDNGGCSHSCLSIEDRIECRCPHGLVLGSDQKTCIKPIPKNLCRILNSCSCTAINENQYSCTCPKGEKCLLLRGRPKIYIEPAAPYEITPGGNLNITCSAVSHPFPQIFWQRGDEAVDIAPVKPGTVRSEQILIIKELYKNTQFTCHANNSLGKTERTIEIVVTGPGSAPIIRGIDAGRSSVSVRWDPPVIVNRPVTSYTVYYTNNGNQPIKNWKKVNVEEPDREVTIKDLRPNTQYFIRLRANDKLGPGRLSNPISLNTRRPAVRPQLFIQEGDTIYVGPLKRFSISCNVTRGDPSPKIAWYTRARPINKSQRKKFITMEHGGLYESTNFSCVAENDAGRTTKRIQVIVTGPTSPERIRYQIHGNNVDLQWEPPRITNGQLKDYDVLYTDNPKLSDEYWEVVKTGNPDVRSLRISNLKEKRDYTFKIRAHNELGPGLFSNQFTLTTWLAARPPIVTITPAEKVVKDPSNEELIFECEAIGVPRPKILWLWSGGLVEDGKNEFRIYDVTPPDAQNRSNSKLIAEKTNRAGVATCQAVNPHGSDEKHTEVKIVGPGSPPRDISTIPFTNDFKVSWNPPKYPNGKIIRYIIYYTKNPDDLLGDWEKTAVSGDQLEVTVSADEDTPYNVRVQAVTKDGPGIISEAYDVTTGKKPVPLSVKLVILDPQVEDGSTETVIEPLKTIIFKCDAKGRPAPQISYTWLPFNETESGQEPISIPAYSDPQEAHRYHSLDVNTNTATKRALMCNARNIDGSESDQHIFNVLKPGSPPENIQAIIDLDNRVTMSWQEPKYPNGPIVKYKVYLTSDPSEPINHWNIYDVEPSEEPRLVLERGKLQPETPYYIKVAAVGEKGEGLQSDIILFETVSGAPIDEPKDVLATVERDNTMDISWTGPSAYTVYFTPLDQYQTSDDAYKQWDKIVVQSSENFGTLRLNKDIYDILPNKLYRIRVSATNDLSEGPASEPITIRTESGETPPVIHLEPIDNPLTVAPYGSISVRCTATGIPPPIIMWIIGTNASDVIRGPILQLTNLRKDETVTCKAENNAGQAQEVLQILVAGPGTPPNEIVAFPLENQQASIEWTTPDSPNGRITDYIIHYGEVFDGEALPRAWETVHVSAEEPQKHRLVGLKPKTSYAIRLQAMSDRGPGVLSDPIKITTLPLAPAIVQLSDIKVHENNTVAIQFDAPRDPEDPGKPIKEFLIHYTDDDPLSEDAEWKEMFWTEPDDDFSVSIPIGGEHFKPDTKYSIKLIARGEIDSPPSEPIVFQTGDGIVPPEKPQINVDAPDDVIRVPAGSDYTVGCSSVGFPIPRIFWPLSDGPMLRLQDVKETVKAKCVAENEGGRTETPFEIFVTGPGNAPSNIRLNSVRPRTIHIDWDPPTIPNGNITRYIIYYTPLDDQNIVYQMGQIPKKPITEWMTSHKDSEPLIGVSQRADLIDFVEPDTAYAVVLQAVNQDGPGPYSEQHTIRTMSRAREGPPLDLKVEPEGQRSANVEWHRPITSEQLPIGYELYYIKADAKIWEDDLASIDDWSMISITEKDEDRLYYKIDGSLEPDTEYVFRMRAVYPDGPGVFSDACITKTLPDGNAPYILISNGDHGVEGKTEITILPGSALDLSCNATGQPRPAVKWIRSGYYPIDPAWVKADEKYAIWFLKVSNITEDTSFNCVAQSPLGFANWTISVRLVSDLRPTWKNDFLVAKNEDGEVAVHFTNDLPDYLKGSQNPWNIYWTDNPSKPFETWNLIPSNGRPLDRIAIPEMEPGAKYHLVIEQPSAGIKTPVFDIMTPKAASDIRVGTDINGETVLDFKPALATEPIKKYIIKYWPDSNPSAVMYMETPVNVTDKIVLDGLQPEIDYNFMVTAKFDDGDNLASEPTKIRTPSEDIQCHCAHACMFEEDEEGMIIASCYCHNGFKLADDKKSCEPIEEDEEGSIVQVTPPTLIPESEHPKELTTMPTLFNDLLSKSEKFDKEMEILEPKELAKIKPSQTDEFGRTIWQDEQLVTTSRESVSDGFSLVSTDSSQQDRVLSPVVGFDGAPLPTDEYGRAVDNLRNPIIWDNEGRPIGPNGIPLRRNYKGEYIYPVIGKNGQPLPTDINMKPIYPIVGPDNKPFRKNQEGMHIDQYGQIIPTDTSGRPISVDGSPYPTDEYGRYIVDSENVIQQVVPTDELGRVIYPVFYPDGILLATVDDGRFVNEHGHLIPTNDAGLPVNEKDEVLPKDSEGNFVYVGNYILPTDSNGQPVKVQYNGRFLKSDKMGHIIGPSGQLVVVNDYGYPIDESNTVFSTTSDGIFVLPVTDGKGMVVPGTEQKKGVKRPLNIVGPNGHLLPTMEDGTVLDPFGKTIPTNNIGEPVNYRNEPLPTNSEGQAIYPKDGLDCPLPPTDRHGRPVYSVVGPDGRLLPRKHDGAAIDPDGNLLPTNAAGVPVDRKGRPLPSDRNGSIIYPARGISIEPLPTDSNGKPVYPVIGLDGRLLPTNKDARVIDEDGRPLPTNAAGVPVNEQGEPLPFDQNGYIRYPAVERQGKSAYIIIGTDGEPLPRNGDGLIIGPDNKPVPTDASGYPVDHRGRPLPQDRSGNIIYPANGIDAEPMPTDRNGRPMYLVIGPDGQLLPKDSNDVVIDIDGRPIPTNAAGVPLDHYGKPLSVDRNGYVFYPKESYESVRADVPVYAILGPDGVLLKQNADGAIVDPYGRPIPTDSNGYPIDNYGKPLLRDHMGNFIYPAGDLDVGSAPTDASKRPQYFVIGPNGEVLPRGYSGEILDPYGTPIPTNAVGIPINNQGEPLPRDRQGNFIYPATGLDVKLLPTDRSGKIVYPIADSHGEFLPTNEDGAFVDSDGSPIPTNRFGLPVDEHGKSLPKDVKGNFIFGSGNVIGPDGHAIPVDNEGRPINNRGETLPSDRFGNFIYPLGGLDAELLPTDNSDGQMLPTNDRGLSINGQGKSLPTNAAGVPVDDHGKPLPIDSNGNLIYKKDAQKSLSIDEGIYPVIGPDEELLPADKIGVVGGQPSPAVESPVPVYPVIGPNGELLPTAEGGLVIGLDGSPLSTNAAGKPVGPDASLLPTDEVGRVIHLPPEEPLSTFATNEYGHIVYPIVDMAGKPLDKDDTGAHITKNGIPVELNENYLPVDPDGNILPTDSQGNYIFPDLDVMGRILPTDKTSQTLYPLTGRNGQLDTDSNGATPRPDGELGKPVRPDGKPLPTDEEGLFIHTEVFGTHPTKKVVNIEGRPLPTDELGRYLLAPNLPVRQDDSGRLIGPDGQPLPTDDSGNYVYREKMKYPSGAEDDFGHPLPTNEDGFYVRRNDSMITTESVGLMMDGQGVILPTDERGILIAPELPTQTKSYQVLDEQNQILPTDEAGNFLYHNGYPIAENEEGKPISPDGIVLPTTDTGYYVFATTRQKPMIPSQKGTDHYPLPTDQFGMSMSSVQSIYGMDGELLPTDRQLINEEGEEARLGEKVRFSEPAGGILSTDEYGKYIYPALKPNGKLYPTDRGYRPVYPVIGYDGELLPTNDEGLALNFEGHPIPTNNIGRPLDEDGIMLPMDSKGNVVYDTGKKNCDTHRGIMDITVVINVEILDRDSFDHVKKVIQNLVIEHFDLSPDVTQFALVKYAGTAEVPITLGGYNEKMELLEELSRVKIDHIKEHPRLIVGVSAAKQQFASFGREDAGKLMIVITNGQDTYSEDRFKDNIIPMLVVGSKEFEEEIKDWTKSYILVDSWKQLHADSIANMIEKECLLGRIFIPTKKVSSRPKSERFEDFTGSSLTTDEFGRIVVLPTSERVILSTDEYGHVAYSIKDTSGRLLPINGNGLVMDRELVESDYSKPIASNRRQLPTDESEAHIYSAGGKDKALSPDSKKGWDTSIDEKPLSTNQDGLSLDINGQSIVTNLAGKYSSQGSPYSFNGNDNIIMSKRTEKITDATDYPVIDPDNILLSRDPSDFYINNIERVVERDDSGKHLGSVENMMPSDAGGFTYRKHSQGGKLPRSDSNISTAKNDGSIVDTSFHKRLPYTLSNNKMSDEHSQVSSEEPEAIAETRNFINNQNSPLPIEVDQAGKPVVKVEPLPTNKYGDSIYAGGSMVSTSVSEQAIGPDDSLMPVDYRGRDVSDYIPDRTGLGETKLLAKVSTCNKVEKSVNIIFMVESSNATGTNLNKIKFSLLNFIKKNINWNIAKVGIVSYGSTMNVNLKVGNYQSYDDLKKSILSLSLIGGSSSGDEHAFRTALQLFREKYNNDSEELIMHVFKTPLSKDAQIIADHLKMNETISILSLGSDQWYRLENDKEIKKLRSDMCLLLMKSHLARTRKPSDSDGGTVRSDRFGRPLDTYALSLPTDKREGVEVLPTNERGHYAKQIKTVNEDKTIAPDGKIISADGGKQHIYQTFASENRHRSTNSHRKLIYQIFGDDRRILPTDQTDARFKVDGKSGATNFYGEPLNSERSSIFSTDTSEGYHISTKKLTENKRNSSLLYPATDSNLKTIADTFVSATSVSLPFLILFPDGRPLSIGENGAYLDDNGQSLVHIDQSGHPIISANGTPLQKIGNGKYLYPYESQKEKPTFANVGDEDHLLRTDSGGRQIQLNDRERSINGYGRSSPEDERGSYVGTTLAYHASTSSGIDTWTSPSSYCVVSSNVDMLLILDSSSSVRVVDYRIMKDFIKKFLTNHFNLQRNYVRVGVMKYGDKVEIPISLGDYNSQTELLSRISETRRMRGNANLGQALLDASGEFLIFGSKDIPRIIIIFSNGRSRGELKENALLLRNDTKVHIFLVDVGNQGDKAQNLAIVGESNPHRIIAIDGWHGMRPDILNPFVNELCKLLPQKQDKASGDSTWPTRQTEMRIATPMRICSRVDFQADIIFVLDSSDSVTSKEYVNLKEDISMLIDDIFDLSPDIVRIGFIEYSDKASVPVPLGYYDNKVQLLADISNSEQLGGTPVIVRGLHAAKEQFKRHGRNGVSRILLLVTSGANRGNVATAADDLRKRLKVSVFALVVNTSRGAQMMLNRLTGDEHTHRRVISISSASKLQERELLHIGQILCGDSDVIPATIWPAQETPHRTTKRDVSYGESKRKKDKISRSSLLYWKTTTATEHVAPKPLCKDGLLRPYQISIVVDNTARSPEKDFRLVLNHIVSFLKMRFSPESKLVQLNLVGVGSDGTNLKAADFGVDVADKIFAKLIQKKRQFYSLINLIHTKHCRSDEISPKLGRGLDEAMLLAKEHAVKGVIQIILIISADGTSSDDAIQSAQNAREQYVDGIVAISIRAPSSELLKELSLGSSTKVIHFPDWSIGNELFQSWISHAFCSYVSTSITRKIKLTRMTRPPIRKTSKISMNDATNVEVTPLSPNSLLVSWTCCTNNKADYIISYTSDLSLPKEYWHKLNATCRDSFGRKIDGLPSGTYSVCVETLQRYINKSVPFNTDECETIKIDSDTTAPPDQKLPNSQSTVQCQCICANNGKAFVKPTCGTLMDSFRPVATLPPAIDGECHCSIPSKGGRCPSGYFFDRGQCYDVDECEQQNGGCSHGCVNTPGDFYCACPHGMMRDPADLKMCISVAGSFDRIVALFGQYLHANQYNANATSNEKSDAQTDGKVVRYKATVKSEDDKTISFEWSLMPAVVRKAFKWLF
ncbi:unnamed protein product [Brugia pahangi]|uniref:Fibronectin type-III domain-containing protein n=1 Tax=Brugia pahangi TaxID=6280 RepID=A0A158PRS1_BRUPA|nr:unnamed protein product [Brugia pahangi]